MKKKRMLADVLVREDSLEPHDVKRSHSCLPKRLVQNLTYVGLTDETNQTVTFANVYQT